MTHAEFRAFSKAVQMRMKRNRRIGERVIANSRRLCFSVRYQRERSHEQRRILKLVH